MTILDEGETRLKLVAKINEALANIPLAEKRVREVKDRQKKMENDFKAQVGTAEAELEKARAAYDDVVNRLAKLIPGLRGVDPPAVEMTTPGRGSAFAPFTE